MREAYARQVLAPQGVKIVAYADQEQVYADLVAGRLQASLQDAQQAQSSFCVPPKARISCWDL